MSIDTSKTKERISIMQAWVDGKTVQIRDRSGSEPWSSYAEQCEPEWDWTGCDYRIKPLEFPKLPEGLEWGYVGNLTADDYEDGYRPATKTECDGNFIAGGWYFSSKYWRQKVESGFLGAYANNVEPIRVPISTPFPKPPKKKVMVAWDSTDDFPRLPVIWIRGKDDYREHLIIGYAHPCAIITATCGSHPVVESMHLNRDRYSSLEWSADRKNWQPCEKEA